MVGGLARRGVAAQVTLDAVVAHTADGHRATLHLEVFLAVDAIAHGLCNVQRQVLHRDVVAALDGMLGVSLDIQRAIALQLQLSFAVDAGLLLAARAVGQRVHRAILGAQLYALAVDDLDDGIAGICQRQACQRHRAFVGAAQHQRAIGAGARQLVSDLVAIHRLGILLHDGHVSAVNRCHNILGHITCHLHGSRNAVVGHRHQVVGHLGVIHRYLVHISKLEGLAHNGHRGAIGVGHVARTGCGELIGDAALTHVQRLCRQAIDHHGCQKKYADYLFHFTISL